MHQKSMQQHTEIVFCSSSMVATVTVTLDGERVATVATGVPPYEQLERLARGSHLGRRCLRGVRTVVASSCRTQHDGLIHAIKQAQITALCNL